MLVSNPEFICFQPLISDFNPSDVLLYGTLEEYFVRQRLQRRDVYVELHAVANNRKKFGSLAKDEADFECLSLGSMFLVGES